MTDLTRRHWSVQTAELHNLLQPRNAHDDDRSLVYGYIRTREPRPNYVMACRRALAHYADEHALRIGQVFVDHSANDDSIIRLGFSAMTDVLRMPQARGALVVHQRHLSPDPNTAAMLTYRITSTGARLYTVRGDVPPSRPQR